MKKQLSQVPTSCTHARQNRRRDLPALFGLAIAFNAVSGSARDLGNGLNFQAGQSLDVFKTAHPASRCWDLEGDVNCGIDKPTPGDCPSSDPCDQPVYVFRAGVLAGFSASYSESVWRTLMNATVREYGRPLAKGGTVGSMSIRISAWMLKTGNTLRFTHYAGTDFNGNAIARPFTIGYGPNEPQ